MHQLLAWSMANMTIDSAQEDDVALTWKDPMMTCADMCMVLVSVWY